MAGNLQLCKELALMDLENLHQLERKEVAHLFLRFDYFSSNGFLIDQKIRLDRLKI
jgi:hypothetical protein